MQVYTLGTLSVNRGCKRTWEADTGEFNYATCTMISATVIFEMYWRRECGSILIGEYQCTYASISPARELSPIEEWKISRKSAT